MSSTPRYVTSIVSSGQVLSGHAFTDTDIYVESGGTIEADTLGMGAKAYLHSGGSAVSISVSSGGYISGAGGAILLHDTVYSGGYQDEGTDLYGATPAADAIGTLILSDGKEEIDNAGVSIGATVEAGGLQEVYQGLASATMVLSGGEVEVFFGSATDVSIERGAQLIIEQAGSAAGQINSGGVAVLQPTYGETATLSGLNVAAGGALVLIGDAAEQGAVIAAGGLVEHVAAAVFEQVGADSLLVSAGDVLSGSVIGDGASAFVYSGGVISAPVIGFGGSAFVMFGGTALDATIVSGGTLELYGYVTDHAPAKAIDPQLFAGGKLFVSAYDVVSGAEIHSGGIAYANASHAEFSNTTVLRGGLLIDANVGGVVGTDLLPGAALQVLGATASKTVVGSGASLVVQSSTLNATVVENGGQLTLEARGNDTLSGGTIEAGGTMTFVSGYGGHGFTDFTLGSGATLVELAGAIEYGLTIDPGATVISGNVGLFTTTPSGDAYGVVLPNRLLSAGNTLTGVTVAASGYLEDAYGGSVSGLTIESTGTAELLGGTVSGAAVEGYLEIVQGGVTAVTIGNGGQVVLLYGTLQSSTIDSGGSESVENAAAVDTIISGGGMQYDNSSATYTTVLGGGTQTLDAYLAHAKYTTVDGGGTVVVTHGTLTDATLAIGGKIDLNYATFASGATVSLNSGTDLLTITEGGSSPEEYTLQLAGDYAGETFHVAASKVGGTMITVSAAAAVATDHALVRELAPGGFYAVMSVPEPAPQLAGSACGAAPAPEVPFGHIVPHAF